MSRTWTAPTLETTAAMLPGRLVEAPICNSPSILREIFLVLGTLFMSTVKFVNIITVLFSYTGKYVVY